MNVGSSTKRNISFQYLGDLSLLEKPVIAVIGKRDVDKEVLQVAYRLGQKLAKNGFCVLNRMALGRDAKAIEGALSENGKVIAVLPCGLDDIYPATCKPLAEEILRKGGLLVSQYPLGTRPDKKKFIERDRVQALLSNKIISVFCDSTGGTMHTLKYAYQDKKQIGCMLNCTGNEIAVSRMGASKIENVDAAIGFAGEPEYKQLSFFE